MKSIRFYCSHCMNITSMLETVDEITSKLKMIDKCCNDGQLKPIILNNFKGKNQEARK